MRIRHAIEAAKSARAIRLLTLLSACIAVAAVGAIALAAPPVPTPSIKTGPASSTSQTSASFTFTGANGLTFQCSLDGSSFAPCTSPKAYAGPLAPGSHTFQVRARNSAGQLSSPASRTWTIDLTPPPTPQITEAPPSQSASKSATFAFKGSESGVSFLCKLDGTAYAACTSKKTYANLGQGAHTFSVVARDAAGNTGAPATRTWTVDTVNPPRPNLTGHPTDPSSSSTATFTFSVAEAGVSFECKRDNAAWGPCTSPVTYTGLARGWHAFRVRTVDAAGNKSPTADWEWRVNQQDGQPFTVSGNLTGLLAPGLSGELALTVSNPNSEAILVTSLTVTVVPGSTKPGCDGPTNIQITQSSASVANPLTVPANGSVTIPGGGVSAPQVLMRNLPTNQDACKGATFSFSYGGSAHS